MKAEEERTRKKSINDNNNMDRKWVNGRREEKEKSIMPVFFLCVRYKTPCLHLFFTRCVLCVYVWSHERNLATEKRERKEKAHIEKVSNIVIYWLELSSFITSGIFLKNQHFLIKSLRIVHKWRPQKIKIVSLSSIFLSPGIVTHSPLLKSCT